jgi:hypothetical protein
LGWVGGISCTNSWTFDIKSFISQAVIIKELGEKLKKVRKEKRPISAGQLYI